MNKCTAFRLTKIFLSLASLVHGFRGATPSAWHLSSSLLSSTSTTKVTEAMMPATGTSRIVCRDDGVVLVPMKPFHLRDSSSPSRRAFLQSGTMLTPLLWHPMACRGAAQREPLPELLYRILRVREATVQETRLIKSGKFKDVQRANVKLAVKFMIDNYRLNDAFVGASVYLDGGSQRRVDAGQVGQRSVQNLYTILEYFDSADVENLKVSMNGSNMVPISAC